MLKPLTIFVALAVPANALADEYENQVRRIEFLFSIKKTGHSPDVYLVKDGGAGLERVGIIYGFADDFSFCRDIADLYMRRHPTERYICELANK